MSTQTHITRETVPEDQRMAITVCLYAYSHLSFSGMPRLADSCNEQYHLLREYVFEHPEVRGILGAID